MSLADLLKSKKEAKAKANLEAGQAFLAENALKEGVISLELGWQYEILKEGNGAKPSHKDKVQCHYHGTLIDGKVFDSSVKRGKPAVFPLNRVIAGWTIALQMMPVGSKWRIFLPPQLAYGAEQVGMDISPNSTLIFEVELLGIE